MEPFDDIKSFPLTPLSHNTAENKAADVLIIYTHINNLNFEILFLNILIIFFYISH